MSGNDSSCCRAIMNVKVICLILNNSAGGIVTSLLLKVWLEVDHAADAFCILLSFIFSKFILSAFI
jgi:hypothetical protein